MHRVLRGLRSSRNPAATAEREKLWQSQGWGCTRRHSEVGQGWVDGREVGTECGVRGLL